MREFPAYAVHTRGHVYYFALVSYEPRVKVKRDKGDTTPHTRGGNGGGAVGTGARDGGG